MIRPLRQSDISGLNSLLPPSWKYDYEAFLKTFIVKNFFSAFVMIHEDKIIGTGNSFLKDKIGWLANIVVEEGSRGRGLGYEMTKFVVDDLKGKGCETQLLVATELGKSVYLKLGFEEQTEYLSFESETDSEIKRSNSFRELLATDFHQVCQIDKDINGEDRTHLLRMYFDNGIGYFNNENKLLGFYLPDFSRGLVLALDEEVGLDLLKLKHSEKGRRTMLPIENSSGVEFFQSKGFQEGESCSRMILGKVNHWKPKSIFSYGGGFCG